MLVGKRDAGNQAEIESRGSRAPLDFAGTEAGIDQQRYPLRFHCAAVAPRP
jgi:hypothetical protein